MLLLSFMGRTTIKYWVAHHGSLFETRGVVGRNTVVAQRGGSVAGFGAFRPEGRMLESHAV